MADEQKRLVTPRQKQSRKRGIAMILFAMLSFLVMVVLVLALLHFYQENQTLRTGTVQETTTQDGRVYSQEEVDSLLMQAREQAYAESESAYLTKLEELMLSGGGTIGMLRYFFPDKIVFADSGSYFFEEINEQLALHPYHTENLVVTEQNEFEYYENDALVSHKGIDVSSFQGKIDWERVAADGVEFAIIRMGIRGYGSGKLVEDEQFQANMTGALAAGIDVGVYFFTQAISTEEAIEEAEMVLTALAPYDIRCTIVLDVEDVDVNSARTNELTKQQWTENCIAFCERVAQDGYTPMIYGNLKTFMLMLDLTQLEAYDKWFAAYTPYFYYPYDFEIWQYSDSGIVDGIREAVDLNISFYDWSSREVE